MDKVTEQASRYDALETRTTGELLSWINREDQTVADTVAQAIQAIEPVVDAVVDHLLAGGRLIYLGAGTSGRLGVVDASECPPTFGVPDNLVVGLIAGGDGAIRKAVEFAEDDPERGWKDLQQHEVSSRDFVIGIAASGTTPYVVGALERCAQAGIATACITCNPGTPLAQAARWPIEVVVGPEFVTGSTRMKAGTAQKLVLNMISTAAMVRIGRVQGNRMVDMRLANSKLVERGTRMVAEATGLDAEAAERLLLEKGSVRAAIESHTQEKKE